MKMINKKIEKELETSINNTISNNSNFFNEEKLNEMKTNVFSSLDFSTLKEKEKSKKKKHVFIFNKKLFLQISVTSLVCLIFIGILSLPFALNVSAGNNTPGDKNPSGEDGSQGIDGEVSESIKIFNNEETFKKELDIEKEKYDFLSNYYVFDISSSLLDKNNLNITNYYIISNDRINEGMIFIKFNIDNNDNLEFILLFEEFSSKSSNVTNLIYEDNKNNYFYDVSNLFNKEYNNLLYSSLIDKENNNEKKYTFIYGSSLINNESLLSFKEELKEYFFNLERND